MVAFSERKIFESVLHPFNFAMVYANKVEDSNQAVCALMSEYTAEGWRGRI